MTELRGLDDFEGRIVHQPVAGPVEEALGGRIALIGDPAAVAQLTSRLADRADTLKVFQRRGVWVLPRLGPLAPSAHRVRPILPRSRRRAFVARAAGMHLRSQVSDPWVRRQLTPTSPPTRTTTVLSNRYYAALRRPDVQLVTWPIAGVVAQGVRTADGIEHHVDTIVVAHADPPFSDLPTAARAAQAR